MNISRDQNAGQNSNTEIGDKPFEIVEQFKYLGTTLTYQNSIHEEMKSRLKSENASYHSFSLLSKNVKIKIYRTIILLVILYGCENWSLKLSEECRLRVSENRLPRRVFVPKRSKVTEE
jgi:hypothetical protein